MNYKTIEYRNIVDKGIFEYRCFSDSTSYYLDTIDYETTALFGILLEPIKNYVINRVYLKIKSTETINYALYAKSIEGENLNKEVIVSKAYYDNEEGRYVLDITGAFDNNAFDSKYIELLSENTFEFYNMLSTADTRPVLVVEYIEIQETLTQEKNIRLTLSDNVSCGVGVSFGVSKVIKPLADYGGEVMPHNLSLSYCGTNHDQVNFNGMPKGWILNYQQKVEHNSENNNYLYTDGFGNQRKFIQAIGSSTTFYEVSGSGLILICNSDNTYKIIDGYNNTLTFNSNGLLTNISEKINSNVIGISIFYDSSNRINRVMDGMGRNIYFSYYSDYIHISGIGMKSYSLKFDLNNLLTKIIESGNQETIIEYNAACRISIMSNSNSEQIVFTYDNIGRVINIQQKVIKAEEVLSEDIKLTYNIKSTLVKDMMQNYTRYVFDDERNIVQVIQDDKNIKRNERNGLSIIKTTLKEESYRSYRNTVINLNTLQDLYNYNSDSQNSFSMVEGKIYALIFKYTVNQLTPSSIAMDLTTYVNQSGVCIHKQTMFVSPLESKYATIYFVSQNSSDVYFKFSLKGGDVSVSLEDVKLYQCKEQKTRVCIDFNTESIFATEIGSKTWYELDSNYKGACYGYEKVPMPGVMYLEDLLETQKNLNSSSMNLHIWYNKKRGLVVNSKAYIEVGNNYYDLKDIKIGVISESDKITTLNYNDYTEADSFNTEYVVYKSNNTEYTTKTKYDSNFLVKKTEDYNGIITTYSYDSYGHLLQEEVSNGNVNFKMLKTYAYTDHYLTQETMMINGSNKSISFEYDSNNGNLLKTTYQDGGVVENKFDSTSRKLVKISTQNSSNDINVNEISYDNDLVKLLKGTTKGYGFTYGKYNDFEKVHQGDLLIGETNTTFDNFEVIKKYNLKRTPNTFIKYHSDKYGNVFLIEKSSDDSTYTPVKKVFYSDKDVDKIIDNDFPNSQNLSKSSNSKLRRVIDDEVGNEQLLYYDSDGKLTKLKNTSTNYLHQPK